jgi:2-C-methyl-D-erythritol 2,4-cyclodiphosphate synthase
VVFSLECKTPKIAPHESAIKKSVAKLLEIEVEDVAVHATTGEGLTSFGKGEGIYCQCTILLHKS